MENKHLVVSGTGILPALGREDNLDRIRSLHEVGALQMSSLSVLP